MKNLYFLLLTSHILLHSLVFRPETNNIGLFKTFLFVVQTEKPV